MTAAAYSLSSVSIVLFLISATTPEYTAMLTVGIAAVVVAVAGVVVAVAAEQSQGWW